MSFHSNFMQSEMAKMQEKWVSDRIYDPTNYELKGETPPRSLDNSFSTMPLQHKQ